MPTKAELGRRLRIARFERDLTLKEVAARCGMSATHISEVERGKTSPTIGALQRIANALGEKASYFVEEDVLPRLKVTRVDDRCTYYSADASGRPLRVEAVSRGIPGGYMQIFRHVMEPGSTITRQPRIGETVLLCTAGMIRISVGDESHVLRDGDTIQLRLDEGHRVENIGDEEAEALEILTGPTLLSL